MMVVEEGVVLNKKCSWEGWAYLELGEELKKRNVWWVAYLELEGSSSKEFLQG